MLAVSDELFASLVSEVLDELPKEHAQSIENVAFVYATEPTREQREKLNLHKGQELLGLYEGVPLTRRQGRSGYPPDKITLFKLPLLEKAESLKQLKTEIRHTIWHEVAHYFGLGHPAINVLEKSGHISGPICSDIHRADREAANSRTKRTGSKKTLSLFGAVKSLFMVFIDPEVRGLMIFAGCLLAIGTGFYMYIEKWDVIESFYFSVATLTTVGYGDLHPTNDISRLFTSVFVLTGVGFILTMVNIVAHQVTRPVVNRIKHITADNQPRDIND